MAAEPAYTRLQVDERRRQLLDAGAALFAANSFEEISMRQIAEAAGVSKPLLYHYFASKDELFIAAVTEAASELQALIEPSGEGTPVEQLTASLDGYLGWIEANGEAWAKPDAERGVAARCARSRRRLPRAHARAGAARADGRTQAAPRAAHRPSKAGSASWTPRSSIGSSRATCRARSCATCCSPRSSRALLAAQQIDPKIELKLG